MSRVKSKPHAAVVVFVSSKRHPNCVLIGIRKNAFGEGTYALPGGSLEFCEPLVDCGRREVLEETGLTLLDVVVDGVLNAVWPSEEHHFVTFLLRAEIDDSHQLEPINVEPHKCHGWEWHDWDNLPDKLFRPLKRIKDAGYSPFQDVNSKFNCIEFLSTST